MPLVTENRKSSTRQAPEGLVRALAQRVEVRADGGGDGMTLAGHFAPFRSWTQIHDLYEGDFMEQINPGAFRKTLSDGGQSSPPAHHP